MPRCRNVIQKNVTLYSWELAEDQIFTIIIARASWNLLLNISIILSLLNILGLKAICYAQMRQAKNPLRLSGCSKSSKSTQDCLWPSSDAFALGASEAGEDVTAARRRGWHRPLASQTHTCFLTCSCQNDMLNSLVTGNAWANWNCLDRRGEGADGALVAGGQQNPWQLRCRREGLSDCSLHSTMARGCTRKGMAALFNYSKKHFSSFR